ncbi:MAG: protein-disulfide reductase DsbD family protein [Terracidiphilus sp.]|nr:protein-disulfide reductase DsbD family protein [Terracidiphilus sp.]
MRLPRLLLALSFLLTAGLPALAASKSADLPHVHVELLVPGGSLYPGDKLNDVGIYFKLEQGWHIYWKNPGDAGFPPHVSWSLPSGITAGAMQFPAPKRLPLGPLMDFGYDNEVLFPLKLHVADGVKGGPVTLHAKVDWLVCQERCIPGKAELEIQSKVWDGPHTPSYEPDPLFKRFFGSIPKPLPASAKATFQPTPQGFRIAVDTNHRETSALFFPADQDILDNPAPQKFTATAKGFTLHLKKDANLTAHPSQLKGVLELSGGRAFDLVALSAPDAAGATPAPASTPAAPVPAAPPSSYTTAQFVLPPSSSPAPAAPSPLSWLALLRTSGLAFLGGLLLNLMPCVFPVLFIKGLALVSSGHKQQHKMRAHGLVYAAGILVSFWVLVAVLLGLRAAGATLGWGFQFQSPVFLALMAALLFFLGLSLAGQFEIGLTLTSAGGSLAQKEGYTGSFFTGVLAVIVATPCTAPFMGAAIGYALSAPPAVTFAVFTALALGLAAPYVALTLQPAWTRILPRPGAWMEVLRQAVSVPIFATVIWLAWVLAQAYGAGVLASLLASFLLLAIAGWFLGRWPAKRWATLVAVAFLLGVVALSVLAPARLTTASETSAPADTNGVWQPWSQTAVNRSLAAGQPVFVDFTARWCLSCQVNERVALQQPEVVQAFQARNVVLMKADWTRHDEAITQALTALGRSGVPAYALYTPGQSQPQMLPEVLTPGIVTDALSNLPKH